MILYMFNSAYVEMLEPGRARIQGAIDDFLKAGGQIQEISTGSASSTEVLAKVNGGGVIPCTNYARQAKKRDPAQYDSTREKGVRTLASIRKSMIKGLTTQEAADIAGVSVAYAYKVICANNLRHLTPEATAQA